MFYRVLFKLLLIGSYVRTRVFLEALGCLNGNEDERAQEGTHRYVNKHNTLLYQHQSLLGEEMKFRFYSVAKRKKDAGCWFYFKSFISSTSRRKSSAKRGQLYRLVYSHRQDSPCAKKFYHEKNDDTTKSSALKSALRRKTIRD